MKVKTQDWVLVSTTRKKATPVAGEGALESGRVGPRGLMDKEPGAG